jgi:hypothetical protein
LAYEVTEVHRADPAVGGGEVFGEQEGDMSVGALFGHAGVREVVEGVDHGDALGADFRDQSGEFRDARQDEGSLPGQIAEFGIAELVVVQHRIVEEPACQTLTDGPEAQFVAVQGGLGGQFGEPLLEVLGPDE